MKEQKYNLIFFRSIFQNGNDDGDAFFMLSKTDGGVELQRACYLESQEDSDFQFSQSEINEIIAKRPEYEAIIKNSMVEVK